VHKHHYVAEITQVAQSVCKCTSK